MHAPDSKPRLRLGLALSGGGSRSSFYIGFLEVLSEENIPIDYIAACSGGSLVAAAFACGTLPAFKKKIFNLDKDTLKTYFTRTESHGGLFSLDLLEEEIRLFTKGLRFEEVRPLMGFVAVDIESGQKVLLCMGDIAKAARISCTLPGVFTPVKWGGKTLVDGGLLTMVPGDVLVGAGVDVSVGINMRGTRHIFSEPQIRMKKILNFFKRVFFIDWVESLFDGWLKPEASGAIRHPGFFEVLGKSLDLAIKANQSESQENEACDLMITPELPKTAKDEFSPRSSRHFYSLGRQCAFENLKKIQELIKIKHSA